MASNLTDMFNHTVGEQLIRQASGILGESAEGTTSALQSIVPALFGALITRAGTDEGASMLMSYMAENNMDGSILANGTTLLAGGIETEKLMYSGAGIVRFLLDDKFSGVVDIIAGGSGLKTSSATSLLKLAAPFLMGIVGKQVKEKGLDVPGLKNLILGQQEYIKKDLSLGVSNLLGLSAAIPKIAPASMASSKPNTDQTPVPGPSKLLPWIVLGLAALALFYFVQKGCGGAEPTVEAPAVPMDTVKVDTNPTQAPSNPNKTYSLAGGATIDAIPGSFTGKLADFLTGSAPGQQCMTFDRVSFESGSFKISSGSDTQLGQLATLLKAYPDAKVSIDAHTDNAGDTGKNKTLSKERAKVIKDWLTDHGVKPGQIDTKGMGGEKPIASNDTETGRKQNRRVEVCVTKK